MKISVIIPVWNRPREVVKAIESALGQTLPPFEIIVADDGSTDGTGDAVAAFGPPVRLIRQDQRGPAAARNRAAAQATGDWLAFLDSDDRWLPGKLERQAQAIQDSGAAMAHSNGWIVTGLEAPADPATLKSRYEMLKPAQGADCLADFLYSGIITSSLMIRRDVFEAAGGFDESFRVNEDVELNIRLLASSRVLCFTPEPLVIMRVLLDGHKARWLESLLESIRAQQKALSAFPRCRAVLKASLAKQYRNAAHCAIVQADGPTSARCLIRSFQYRFPTWREAAAALILLAGGKRGEAMMKRRWKRCVDFFGEQA
ncbi:MAG TPA: glycosyltransferase family A protein [bacterium]|nr:glycosyltransferase family A protein [bacterium]